MEIITPELQEIEIKIIVLDKILQEARANGDDRWHEPARQIEMLNNRRSEIIKAERIKRGLIEPESQRITAKLGTMGAKTNNG